VVDPDGSITISGHLGAQVCGGVHPASSTWHPGVATFTVMPSAAVQRLRNSGHGPVDVPINAASLPTYLTGDTNGRFFVYTGPSTAIVSMTELYYP